MLEVERHGRKGFRAVRGVLEAVTYQRNPDYWVVKLYRPSEEFKDPEWWEITMDEAEASSSADALRQCLAWVRATDGERMAALVKLGRFDAASTAHEAAEVAKAIKAARRQKGKPAGDLLAIEWQDDTGMGSGLGGAVLFRYQTDLTVGWVEAWVEGTHIWSSDEIGEAGCAAELDEGLKETAAQWLAGWYGRRTAHERAELVRRASGSA